MENAGPPLPLSQKPFLFYFPHDSESVFGDLLLCCAAASRSRAGAAVGL